MSGDISTEMTADALPEKNKKRAVMSFKKHVEGKYGKPTPEELAKAAKDQKTKAK